MINAEYIERFIEAAHRVGQERLQLCSSGNLSWRVNKDLALVSGTGSWLPRITKENVAICNISTGQKITVLQVLST